MIIIITELSVAIICLSRGSTMRGKIFLLTFVTFFQLQAISAQRQWVPPTATAAEMRNPYTWYWPYAIAASEAYRDYFVNAQQISNQLHHQAYITQAFQGSSQWGDSSWRGEGYPRRSWGMPKPGGWSYSVKGSYGMPSGGRNF